MPSAPARLKQSKDSNTVSRSFNQPFMIAALCIAYSPETW
ncbi:Uncharacterised protein [Vibrio cholerae]|nr:Uncharacterised protein [Vibrio cholerae]